MVYRSGKRISKNYEFMGIGHRVYKAYDPRARIMGPIAEFMVDQNADVKPLFYTAKALEKEVAASLSIITRAKFIADEVKSSV